jgi:hypothetical protein
MLEVVSLPYASAEYPSGRELVFLPALLDIIQAHTLKSMESDFDGYMGMSRYTKNMQNAQDMTIVFSEDDLSTEITKDIIDNYFVEGMLITDEGDADKYMTDSESNTVVSYVVAPTTAKAGSYCYKMLFDNQSHTLYYFRRHRISTGVGVGFLAEDIKRIASHR